MLSTYRATLRGHVLEWTQDEPGESSLDQPIEVYVTFLTDAQPAKKKRQGRKMSLALAKIAGLPDSSVRSLNASTWQWEVRQERVLSGRMYDKNESGASKVSSRRNDHP